MSGHMKRRLQSSIVLALICWIGGCAAAPRAFGADPGGQNSAPDRLVIVVESQYNQDVEVLFVGGAATSRLGYVASNTVERFSVDRARFPGRGRVQMVVQTLIGGEPWASPPLTIVEGDGLLLRIGSQLSFSQLVSRR